MFTEEWIKGLIASIKSDDKMQQIGQKFDSTVHFVVKKDRKGGTNSDVEFGLHVPSTEPNWIGPPPDDVDIILEAKSGIYSEIFKGKRNVVMALTMGKLKLRKGSLKTLTGNLGVVNRFVELAGSVPG